MQTEHSSGKDLFCTVRALLAWPLEVLTPLCYVPDSIAGLAPDDFSADLLSVQAEATR
jgi:hypothetical protein